MKGSLLKDIITYAKTKGKAPLDERQMDNLKELYMELAKSAILGFITFTITYGCMERYGQTTIYNFMNLSCSLIGGITYYYLIRSCYMQVIGMDVNFEILLIPGLLFTPFVYINTLWAFGPLFHAPRLFYIGCAILWPVLCVLLYLGVNRIYKKGRAAMEQEVHQGELHFRSRKQITNFLIIIIVLVAQLPLSHDLLFRIATIVGSLMIGFHIWYYGFSTPHNEYILNESGLIYHRALWNKKGGFLRYEEIAFVKQQDTFNVGYSKDKVCIHCHDGREIMLYPENAYRFCTELENNL